jgi:hypothetical protein
VETQRSEALSLLRKWSDEYSLLYCEVNFKTLAVGMEGRIVLESDDRVSMMSDNRVSTLRLALGLAVAFGYGDTRGIPGESDKFDSGLVIFFDAPDSEHPELVTFIERRVKS